jgi:hypothetical protein
MFLILIIVVCAASHYQKLEINRLFLFPSSFFLLFTNKMLDKLPRDILLVDILELLDSESLIKLSSVSKYFNYLVNDESIWKKLCLEEFNISQDHAYRNKGWKRLYEALKYHTKVYTWGENFDSRLGLDSPPAQRDTTMAFPFR